MSRQILLHEPPVVTVLPFVYFKLYLFYNKNTWLQVVHEVILLGGELVANIFRQGKPLKISSLYKKNPILLMPAVGFEPMSSQSLSGGVNT